MRTNNYYAARYPPASFAFHCDQVVKDLIQKPLSPDSADVVSPSVAWIIASCPNSPSAGHTLHGFILCSAKTNFGLGPDSSYRSSHDVCVREYRVLARRRGKRIFIGDWHPAEPGGIWSKGYGVVQFRLSPDQRSRYHAVSLHLLVPVGAKGVQYRIQSGGQEKSSTFLGSSMPRVEAFEVLVPLKDFPDGLERIVLLTQEAVRPVDIGMNNDARILGLGVLGMRLIP